MARLETMLKYSLIKTDVANYESDNKGLGDLEQCFDNLNITNPLKHTIHKNTLCVSFYNNNIDNVEYVEELLDENK